MFSYNYNLIINRVQWTIEALKGRDKHELEEEMLLSDDVTRVAQCFLCIM